MYWPIVLPFFLQDLTNADNFNRDRGWDIGWRGEYQKDHGSV